MAPGDTNLELEIPWANTITDFSVLYLRQSKTLQVVSMALRPKTLPTMRTDLYRRRFLQLAVLSAAGACLPACSNQEPEPRYTDADIARLAQQRLHEGAQSGLGPFGPLHFKGYRGLSELPWFELDANGELRIVDLDLPKAIDMHCHLGMSLLLAPEVDLQRRTERVIHLLDCDANNPGCDLDLDVYINRNFSDEALDALWWGSAAQGLWGSKSAANADHPQFATRDGQLQRRARQHYAYCL